MIFKIGPVEKKIYSLREKHPLVIPQIDPQNHSLDGAIKLAKNFQSIGVQHIAVGGSLVNPEYVQSIFDMLIKDFDFTIVTYISNISSFTIKGKEKRTAIYWATVFNANNMFYLRDSLVHGSLLLKVEHLEPLPTAYVHDDRSFRGTSNWLVQPNLIPRDKPEISVANALACQYLGIRFYIMAGGSGALLAPSPSHIKYIKEKTNIFLIPTSGVKSVKTAEEIFSAGADAIHIGALLEQKDGLNKFKQIFESSKKFPGNDFLS